MLRRLGNLIVKSGKRQRGSQANPLRAPADSCLMDAEKPKARQKLPRRRRRRRRRTQLKRLDGVDGGSSIGLEEGGEGSRVACGLYQ